MVSVDGQVTHKAETAEMSVDVYRIANKTERGIPLAVYEQDWLYNEWEGKLSTFLEQS